MASLQDQLRIALFSIWNRRWLALGVAWLVCLGGWLMVTTIPNQYRSHARIFVQLDDVLSDQIGIGADRHRDIDRVRQTLTSAVNLEKVVRATRLGEKVSTEKQMEGAVASLSKAVKVTSQQDNLFEIAATSGSGIYRRPERQAGAGHCQKMIDIFREENLAGGRGEMSDTLAFMDQQLADRQRDLEAAEQKRQQFEAKNPAAAQGAALSVPGSKPRGASCAGSDRSHRRRRRAPFDQRTIGLHSSDDRYSRDERRGQGRLGAGRSGSWCHARTGPDRQPSRRHRAQGADRTAHSRGGERRRTWRHAQSCLFLAAIDQGGPAGERRRAAGAQGFA
jgi:hypothetical protein